MVVPIDRIDGKHGNSARIVSLSLVSAQCTVLRSAVCVGKCAETEQNYIFGCHNPAQCLIESTT
jgi:hypothetical protein